MDVKIKEQNLFPSWLKPKDIAYNNIKQENFAKEEIPLSAKINALSKSESFKGITNKKFPENDLNFFKTKHSFKNQYEKQGYKNRSLKYKFINHNNLYIPNSFYNGSQIFPWYQNNINSDSQFNKDSYVDKPTKYTNNNLSSLNKSQELKENYRNSYIPIVNHNLNKDNHVDNIEDAEQALLESMGWSGTAFQNVEPLTQKEVDEFLKETAIKYGNSIFSSSKKHLVALSSQISPISVNTLNGSTKHGIYK